MKIGSIVLSTNQGLGYLAYDFYKNNFLDHVLVKRSHRMKNNYSRYPKSSIIGPRKSDFADQFENKDIAIIIDFLSKIDILFLFEVPFYNCIYSLCKEMNVKVVIMPMYESTPYPTLADLYICPSKLDLKYYKKMYPNTPSIFLPVPVPNEIVWRERKKAKTFVHNTGNGGVLGRNGTKELIESMKFVKSPIKLILRSQKPDFDISDPRILYEKGTEKFCNLYKEGDVFIFPEKFNGLSLPLQESYASGMLVMTTERFPNTDWLPNEPLIKTSSQEIINMNGIQLEKSVLDPKDIANSIDTWYNKDIKKYSELGKEWGELNSWKRLKQKYLKIMGEI